MFTVTKEGTAPTFKFYCPVCGEEFSVTGYEGSVRILQLVREIDFEKERE